MVGIGVAFAIIRMSNTPFWLANTGGSTKFAARADPAPHAKPAAMLAAPAHRCIADVRVECLLVMGPSLLHAEFAERAVQAAGGRPQASGNGRRAVTSAFRSMICQGMLTAAACRI